MLSHIQNQILSLILRAEGTRYSDAMPEGIDRDLFNYHLKFLIDKKYIAKQDNLYFLTKTGHKYVLQLDIFGNYNLMFRVSVLPYVIREIDGKKELLLHKRSRQPYFGDIASISGKVKYGEKIEDAASRKLQEETGLILSNFKLFGIHRKMRYDKDNNLIEDTLYHCCVGKNPTGQLVVKNQHGENFWADFDTAVKLIRKNIAFSPKTEDVIVRIKNEDFSNLFYWQEAITLKNF